jgi:D-cysteine desulfhydrase
VGRGYALTRPEGLALIREVARTEGVVLDPVYTGKAFYGMAHELAKDQRRFGKRIIFMHTGGIFGLLPLAGEFDLS